MRRKRRSKSQVSVCPVVDAKLRSQTKEHIPVIVRFKNGNFKTYNSKVSSMSLSVKHELPLVEGIACSLSINSISELKNDPNVDSINYDSKVYALLDIANPLVQSQVPHEEGYDGEGVTVAVLDTGVAPHTDLTRPENRIIGFKDFVNDKSSPYDDNGHGTHVSGIIASNGLSSGGKYMGIAPKANIVGVKALDKTGSGSTSDIIKAIEWVINTKDKYNTKILNLSLGSPAASSYRVDPLAQAAEKAARSGLTVVVASGNSGPAKKTILSPGIAPTVITVGAVDDNKTPDMTDNYIANFSSRGPTVDGLKKPDVVAPGVDIMSLSNKSLSGYHSLSGTSMATPVVTGAIALLFQKFGTIKPSQVKSMLKKTCIPIGKTQSVHDEGSGMINLKNLFREEKVEDSAPEISYGSIFSNDIVIYIVLFLVLYFWIDD